jgi:hypothetical protein
MRKVIIIFLGVVSLALLAAVLWFHRPLSDSDTKRITAIVSTKNTTTGSIIKKIEQQRDGTVYVFTENRGNTYIEAYDEVIMFKRTLLGWKIVFSAITTG